MPPPVVPEAIGYMPKEPSSLGASTGRLFFKSQESSFARRLLFGLTVTAFHKIFFCPGGRLTFNV
jgi:hypothetical protein